MDRRRLLQRLAGSAALTLGAASFSGCTSTPAKVDVQPFALGIASGEPSADGMVLWTKITTPGPAAARAPLPVRRALAQDQGMTRIVLAKNPHIKFFNGQRGYLSCDVSPPAWTTSLRVVDPVSRPRAPIRARRSLAIEAGRPGLAGA